MTGSIFGPLIQLLYRALSCHRRWRVGNILLNVLIRLEKGEMTSLTARKILAKYHEVEIGDFSYGPCFRPGFFPPQVRIGKYTSIAAGVRVVNENHPIDDISTHPYFYPSHSGRNLLTIGHDVWIGYNAIILPGCQEVGTGAVIGAGAVVTRNIPPFAIVAGNPAKILRYRFEPDVVEKLIASAWWNDDINDVAQEISQPLTTSSLLCEKNAAGDSR